MPTFKKALCHDDVQLLDGISELSSRSSISLKMRGNIWMYPTPILSAPMDSLCSVDMGVELIRNGVTFIVDRYKTIDERFEMAYETILQVSRLEVEQLGGIGIAVGMKDSPEELSLYLESLNVMIDDLETGYGQLKTACMPKLVCFDVAAAANTLAVAHAEKLRLEAWKHGFDFIFGNFSQADDMVSYLMETKSMGQSGIRSFLKVSQGGGSVCTTRLATGIGNPTFQAVIDLDDARGYKGQPEMKIVADGGIKTSGDMVKMIAAGADFVMIGGLLAAHDECPGEVDENGMKEYRGMASAEAKAGFLGHAKNVEGVSVKKACRGPVANTIQTLLDGLRSGIATAGFISAAELVGNGEFVVVSPNATKMAQPHARDSK